MTHRKIPLLLLKTKSIPHDGYEDYFSRPASVFTPIFVPVLEHRVHTGNLAQVKALLQQDGALKTRYGGMIFTSQRAVEGFAEMVQELELEAKSARGGDGGGGGGDDGGELSSRDLLRNRSIQSPPSDPSRQVFPLYTVGPATSRTLDTLLSGSPTILSPLHPSIQGSHTGNGEALAKHILQHYPPLFRASPQPQRNGIAQLPALNEYNPDPEPPTPPLLFLVGEQRRDIIPRTLQRQGIQVDELVVYETGVMESFPQQLDAALQQNLNQPSICYQEQPPPPPLTEPNPDSATPPPAPTALAAIAVVVIVIFSPSGCRQLLQRLNLLDPTTGRARPRSPLSPPIAPPTDTTSGKPALALALAERTDQSNEATRYIIATIGPTTFAYLKSEFGFEADVCAATPSPEGVGEGVCAYLTRQQLILT